MELPKVAEFSEKNRAPQKNFNPRYRRSADHY